MRRQWKKRVWEAGAGILRQLGQYRLAIANFFSLGLLRATDALVLLFLIPVIIGRVGIDNFGIIAFVQVFLNYGKTIVGYGFNITGVQAAALHAQDKRALSRIFSDILYTRAIIALLAGLGLAALVGFIPYLGGYGPVFFWGYLLILGQVVYADWLFIGLQKAQYITAANLASKLLFAVLVIALVRQPEDHVFVIGLQGGATLATGLLVVGLLKYRYGLFLLPPAAGAVRHYLRSDFNLLLTNLSIEINTSYSLLVINILTTNALTGYFSVMQKLIQPLRFLLVIFSQALFPLVCKKVEKGWKELLALLRNTLSLFILFPAGGTALMFLFAEPLLSFFAGSADAYLVVNFRLYLFVPLIILANIPAYQILLAFGRKSEYSRVYLLGLALNLVASYVLARLYGLAGLVAALILVELFITGGLYVMVWRNRKAMQAKNN